MFFVYSNSRGRDGRKTLIDRILFSALFVFLLIAFFHNSASASSTFRFSASVGEPFTNPNNKGFEDRILQELFRRLGLKVKVQFVPAERAMLNLDDGLDDGCLSRIGGLQSLYPNIRQIEEVSLERDFMVFTIDKKFVPDSWQSLSPYNVGFITGWKILERNIAEAQSITRVKNGEMLFAMLVANRVDLIVYNRWGGLHLAKELGIENIRMLEPPLIRIKHYFYLNKKHENRLGPAAKALAEMKKDGTYQRIFKETLLLLEPN